MILHVLRGLLGVMILLTACTLISGDRKSINWRLVGSGLAIQLTLAILVLKVPFVSNGFKAIVDVFLLIISAAQEASIFLFGDLGVPGGPFGFAFSVLPIIVFFSAITSMLYYFGILQKVVYGFAWVMNKTMKLSGAESLSAAANIFIGQTEAPLVIKPYLERMSKSEILTVMTGGMATIAGSVFGAYVGLLGGASEQAQQEFGMHLLVASIIAAPAAILISKIILPESTDKELNKNLDIPQQEAGSNLLDALANGTTDGVRLAVNVGAMLLAFMALIYLSNNLLGLFGDVFHLNDWVAQTTNGMFDQLSLQFFMGYIFAPLAWTIGINGQEVLLIGQLLGEKIILNEFVAYTSLSDMKASGILSPRSSIIAAYALCGFANFASIGIQIGGISAIAPGQRRTLTELGFKALIGGTCATMLTATIAGTIVGL